MVGRAGQTQMEGHEWRMQQGNGFELGPGWEKPFQLRREEKQWSQQAGSCWGPEPPGARGWRGAQCGGWRTLSWGLARQQDGGGGVAPRGPASAHRRPAEGCQTAQTETGRYSQEQLAGEQQQKSCISDFILEQCGAVKGPHERDSEVATNATQVCQR